jgi:hypothetical protein
LRILAQEGVMTRTRAVWIGLFMVGSVAKPVAAQDITRVAFGTLGLANVYRTEDQSFGTKLNVGGGLGIEWKRLGFAAELHRTVGLTPRSVQCAVGNVPCTGAAREGLLDAMMLSGNILYFFGRQRVRPYVTGSVGVLWTETAKSLTIVSSTAATLSEFRDSNTGLAIGVGVGLDVSIAGSLSLSPEVLTYSSVAMSRVNVGMHRGAISARYRW